MVLGAVLPVPAGETGGGGEGGFGGGGGGGYHLVKGEYPPICPPPPPPSYAPAVRLTKEKWNDITRSNQTNREEWLLQFSIPFNLPHT